jgi:hypothetical protein
MGGQEMGRTKSGLWFAILILISGAIILSPFIANAEYAYRKAITIDHTKVSATLTNFPVLVSILNDNDLKNHVMREKKKQRCQVLTLDTRHLILI